MKKLPYRFKSQLQSFLGVLVSVFLITGVNADTIFDIGDGSVGSAVYAINNVGQIVGTTYSPDFSGTPYYLFIYSDGTLSKLSGLTAGDADITGINDLGQIVGTSGEGFSKAFIDLNGAISYIGKPGDYVEGDGINNSGEVVGAGSNEGAFTALNGTISPLGIYHSTATGINNAGQVVGYTISANNYQTSLFLYSNGTVTNLGLSPTDSNPKINDLGQIAGTNSRGAFLYSNGKVFYTGYSTSVAEGIGSSGQVLGYYTSNMNNTDAFIYSIQGGLQDLDTLYSSLLVGGGSQKGFTSLIDATAINNSGDIIGDGDYWTGDVNIYQGFEIVPAPEPSAWVLLVGGLGLVYWCTRGRRGGLKCSL